jgi:hypothetical protein
MIQYVTPGIAGIYKVTGSMQLRNVEDNLEKTVLDACDNPMPPCIVMERGEAMDLWVARARPDRIQALSVCSRFYSAFVYSQYHNSCVISHVLVCMASVPFMRRP